MAVHFFGSLPSAVGVFPSDPLSPPLVSRDAFTTAVVVTASESFEESATGLLAGAAHSFSNSLTVFGAGNTLSQVAPTGFLQGARVRSGTQFSGRFNTTNGASSGRWIETDSGFTINLAAMVNAIGFFGTDFGDFSGTLTMALYSVVGGVPTLVEANILTDADGVPLNFGATNGSLAFVGYAADADFNRIVVSVTQGAGPLDYLGFDDILIGTFIEPDPVTPVELKVTRGVGANTNVLTVRMVPIET